MSSSTYSMKNKWKVFVEVICFFGTRFFISISDGGLALQLISNAGP